VEAEEDQEEDMEVEGEPSGVQIRGPQGTIMFEMGTGNDRWDRTCWDPYVSEGFFADVGVPDIFLTYPWKDTGPLLLCLRLDKARACH
jgi:hypothetical protein